MLGTVHHRMNEDEPSQNPRNQSHRKGLEILKCTEVHPPVTIFPCRKSAIMMLSRVEGVPSNGVSIRQLPAETCEIHIILKSAGDPPV